MLQQGGLSLMAKGDILFLVVAEIKPCSDFYHVLQLWLATKKRTSPNLYLAGLLGISFGQSIF